MEYRLVWAGGYKYFDNIADAYEAFVGLSKSKVHAHLFVDGQPTPLADSKLDS